MKRDCRVFKKQQADQNDKTEDKRYAVVAKGQNHAKNTWMLDSGASFNMSHHISWFKDYEPLKYKIPIVVSNDDVLYAIGRGNINLLSSVGNKRIPIELKSVYHVPGISDNLLSLGEIDGKGFEVVAKGGHVRMIAPDGNVIISGTKNGSDLYRLGLSVQMKANIAKSSRTLEEWHKALGHPGVEAVRNLDRKKCTENFKVIEQSKEDFSCADCQYGKGHRCSHPESTRQKADGPLKMVHGDIVGPVSPCSLWVGPITSCS